MGPSASGVSLQCCSWRCELSTCLTQQASNAEQRVLAAMRGSTSSSEQRQLQDLSQVLLQANPLWWP